MKTTKKIFKDLPFEEGKTYKTKFQTAENFLIKEIIWDKNKNKILYFKGIFETFPEKICPLNSDRLIANQIESGEIEICSKCGESI